MLFAFSHSSECSQHFYVPSFTFKAGAGRHTFHRAAVMSQAYIQMRRVADLGNWTSLLFASAHHFDEDTRTVTVVNLVRPGIWT